MRGQDIRLGKSRGLAGDISPAGLYSLTFVAGKGVKKGTVWGIRLCKRFCRMFSASSAYMAGGGTRKNLPYKRYCHISDHFY